jgi:hypothetical protein
MTHKIQYTKNTQLHNTCCITSVLPYPWVIRPKTYCGYMNPQIILNAIYNVIFV